MHFSTQPDYQYPQSDARQADDDYPDYPPEPQTREYPKNTPVKMIYTKRESNVTIRV